jgi:small GTP-binding protein
MITSPPYGLKAIRQIKATNTTSQPPAPSARLQKKKEKIYSYFLERVDPLLGDCITHLLLSQPSDVPQAMIEYFQALSQNQEIINPIAAGSKPRKELKLFLATSIGPVVAKLVNRLAVMQPEQIIEFVIKELESIKVEDAIIPDKPQTVPTSQTPAQTPAQAPAQPQTHTKAETKSIQLAVLGLGESGKSSILNVLQGKFEEKIRPTVGFRPSSMMFADDVMIRFYDLGGGKKIRDIWSQYYHDIHGIIYVIDASLPEDKFQETLEVFQSTLENKYLLGKPLLIFANKQDIQGALTAQDLQDKLPLHADYQDHLFIAETTAAIPDPRPEEYSADPNIESAIEMLCKRILSHYEILQARVTKDSHAKAADEARKRIEREKKVLKSKIASAFISQLTTDQVQAMQLEPDLANIFDEEEGLKFLAAEIGEDPANLPPIAIKLAAMVGYQRLALQIVGALKSPISKKKVPMNWNEIYEVVHELRKELLLPDM